ncbi:MAG: hypothetical protein Q8Q00_09230 [Dehalococcoidia bacterium]|jgi:hypothetical protein|nr:hypothetical protein [Dehalococcoidia bacterium]
MAEGADQDRRRGRLPILAGRLLATAFTAFILLFAIGEAATEGLGLSAEGIGVATVFGLAALSVILAWRDAALGVLALAAVGLAITILVAVTAEANQVRAMAIMSSPYFISSILVWFGVRRLAKA